jgi:type I restriction enzyme S subunit
VARIEELAAQMCAARGLRERCSSCVPGPTIRLFVSPEYRTLRCIDGEALPGYISRLVRTNWFWSKLGDATRGIGARRERTRPERLLAIEIPMPDVERQRRGESLFAEVAALQGLQAETAAELDTFIPAVLDRAFRGEL